MTVFAELDTFGVILVAILTTYMGGVIILNTSIGLRMGYNPWRIMPVSFVWPLLSNSARLDAWAKGGACTLPEEHPLHD